MSNFTNTQLFAFLEKAAKATYVGGGKKEEIPERKGFAELVYQKGDWHYRDSWTGFIRSRGMELIRFQGVPKWAAMYGGGMVEGKEQLFTEKFENFLKTAIWHDSKPSHHMRGPEQLVDGDWKYMYQQEGDLAEFSGYEQIFYKNDLVFFHRVIGGVIKHRLK